MAHNPELRKARYDLAIRLGFSASEARAMRDHSAEHIRSQVQETELRLEHTAIRYRTVEQQTRLATIQRYIYQESETPARRAEIEPYSSRKDNWSEWSGNQFPQAMMNRIIAANTSAGMPDFSSFGFRVVYAEYVEGYDEDDALDYADYEEDAVI